MMKMILAKKYLLWEYQKFKALVKLSRIKDIYKLFIFGVNFISMSIERVFFFNSPLELIRLDYLQGQAERIELFRCNICFVFPQFPHQLKITILFSVMTSLRSH